jgi:hypothetical protein
MDEIDEIQAQLRKADLDSIGPAFRRIAEQLDDEALEELQGRIRVFGYCGRAGDCGFVLEGCIRVLNVLFEVSKKR